MSFRSVEMQIAIPRTSEAQVAQNQLLQKPVLDQEALAAKELQQKERELRQSTGVQESDGPAIRQEKEKSGGRESGGKQKRKPPAPRKQSGEKAAHPYKGHHIDLTL